MKKFGFKTVCLMLLLAVATVGLTSCSTTSVGTQYNAICNIGAGAKIVGIIVFDVAGVSVSGHVIHEGSNQQWEMVQGAEKPYFKFKNRNSGKFLQVNSGKLIQADENNSEEQLWMMDTNIDKDGKHKGEFLLKNKGNGNAQLVKAVLNETYQFLCDFELVNYPASPDTDESLHFKLKKIFE